MLSSHQSAFAFGAILGMLTVKKIFSGNHQLTVTVGLNPPAETGGSERKTAPIFLAHPFVVRTPSQSHIHALPSQKGPKIFLPPAKFMGDEFESTGWAAADPTEGAERQQKKNPSRPIQRVCSVENKKDQQATAKKKFEPKKHPNERTDGWWMGTEKGSKVSLVLRKAATCCCYGASVPEKRSVCLLPSSLTFVVFPCCHTPPQTSFLPVVAFPLASSMVPTEARLNHIKL